METVSNKTNVPVALKGEQKVAPVKLFKPYGSADKTTTQTKHATVKGSETKQVQDYDVPITETDRKLVKIGFVSSVVVMVAGGVAGMQSVVLAGFGIFVVTMLGAIATYAYRDTHREEKK